jgi:N-acetyl sugar amidotransferase
MIKKCKKCLYDEDHPFGIVIYSDGICSGCKTHDEKYKIDWKERKNVLQEILKKRIKKNRSYDCIVPIFGDAEDYYIIEIVLSFGLNPLIVHVNNYFNNDIAWFNVQNLITYFDLDCHTYNPNFLSYQNAVKESLRKYNNILWPYLNLIKTYPVHLAIKKNINLIIWGGHQSIEQVGKFSHYDEVEMTNWSRIEHDLFKHDEDEFFSSGSLLEENDLSFMIYPELSILKKKNISGIYLSNYFFWDPLNQNSKMTKYGFKPEINNRSYDIYERAGSSVYYQFHDLTKVKNVGYAKIRDHLVREIRHNRINKKNAIKIENNYLNNYIDTNLFLDWLGLSKSGKEWYHKHIMKNSIFKNKKKIKLNKKIHDLVNKKKFKKVKDFCIYEKQI